MRGSSAHPTVAQLQTVSVRVLDVTSACRSRRPRKSSHRLVYTPAFLPALRFFSNYVVLDGKFSTSAEDDYLPTYAARARGRAANYLPTQRE